MKTKAIAWQKRFMIIAALLFSSITVIYSQQVIKFKNGDEYKVVIVYQTKDTLKYHLPSEPTVIRTILMGRVESIRMESPSARPDKDTTSTPINDKIYQRYQHYQHNMTTGIVLAAGGGVVGVIGIIVLSSAHLKYEDLGFTYVGQVMAGSIVTGIGGALLLTGAILAITSSVNMQDYKKKMHGFSFDVKYTPNMKGISLVYRF